jgi:ZIP family zinc transporter
VQAFAAGALLTMLGDTMIPEAYEAGGRLTGLMLVLGFALAFALTALELAA